MPEIFTVPWDNRKVELLIVAASIASLNLADTVVLMLTDVARLAGLVEVTSGQMPLVPVSSISFLQPVINRIRNNKETLVLFRILLNRVCFDIVKSLLKILLLFRIGFIF